MYVTYQNKICVPVQFLFESGIIQSKGTYDTLRNRGHIKVERSGFDKTRTLINAKEMRPDIRQKVESILGAPGDIAKLKLVQFIEWSKEAETYYTTYRYNDDTPLPEETIHEYIITANILNAIHHLVTEEFARIKITKGQMWENIANACQNLDSSVYPHKLPANARRLQAKFREFHKNGFKSLVHKNFGNEFSVKLTTAAKEWALARWCNQVNRCANLAQLHAEFNEIAAENGWKQVDDEKTFYNFIHAPEIQPLWYAHRHGEKAADEAFGYQHTTILPTRRDSLWYSDGTKLNFYFRDENGTMQTAWVYEVMDAYSDVLLGFNISKKTENFSDQYKAYKMAIQFAGHRPYEIKFDNQGGHKKLVASEFFAKITRLSIRTQPYNGKSKTIESAFGRFQRQIMKRCWFFTGQNVTAHTRESKANMEFIMANQKNLPTYEEAIQAYTELREVWNHAKHHQTGLPRIEMYQNSHNERTPKIDTWDMVNLFWVWHSRGEKLQPLTFTPGGISFELNKQKFEYMVYDEDGMPDMDFIDKSVDKKFFVKYDPEMMDEIYLYERDHGGERFVTNAKLKLSIHRATQDQTDGENSFIKSVELKKKQHRLERFNAMESILENHGIAAWQLGFNTPKVKGIETKVKKTTKTAEAVEVVDFDKTISNLTQNDIYDDF